MQKVTTQSQKINAISDQKIHRSIVANYKMLMTKTTFDECNEYHKTELIDELNQGFVLGYN